MPQRNLENQLEGKFLRNLESTTEETRKDEKESGRNTEDNGFTFSVKVDNVKGGSIIPNRVFVGGISVSTTEWDIRSRFAAYGNIRAVKILRDTNGISRGYGFVTFDTEEEAKATLEKREITFKGRKLNIAPAVRKQNYRSDRLFPTERGNTVNYSGALGYEDQLTRNKGYDEQLGYTNYEVCEAQFPIENPRTQMDNMMPHEAILQSSDCLSAQSINYPINGNIIEIIQVHSAPLCFANGELQ